MWEEDIIKIKRLFQVARVFVDTSRGGFADGAALLDWNILTDKC